MDMQNVSNLIIQEGEVRAIYNQNNLLLWGKVIYDTKYAGDTFQQTYSGKNLLNSNGLVATTTHNVTFTPVYEDGVLLYIETSGIADANGGYTIGTASFENGEQYTISGCSGGSGSTYRFWTSSSSAFPVGNRLDCTNAPNTRTASADETNCNVDIQFFSGANMNNLKFYPQIEQSASATSYEPYTAGPSPNPDYPQTVNVVTGVQTVTISDGNNQVQNYTINLGSTELCKIGNYQDYIYKSGDDWYLHKVVGKAVFSGLSGESWSVQNSGTANYFYRISSYPYGTNSIALSNYFIRTPITGSNTSVGFSLNNNDEFRFRPNYAEVSIADWKTWLGSHNTTVYYPLATPTDTQITDVALIGQLDAIHQFLTRYGYSATVSGNLPLIIDKTNL